MGDLSSCRCKIRIPFPHAAGQHLAQAPGEDHPSEPCRPQEERGPAQKRRAGRHWCWWTVSRRSSLSPSSSDSGANHATLSRLFPPLAGVTRGDGYRHVQPLAIPVRREGSPGTGPRLQRPVVAPAPPSRQRYVTASPSTLLELQHRYQRSSAPISANRGGTKIN